jgi:hypothetical protein
MILGRSRLADEDKIYFPKMKVSPGYNYFLKQEITPIALKEAIQIEITNACMRRCSNCTRLVGHQQKPYMMKLDYFKEVVDNIGLEGTALIVGIIGGEPLMHPRFKEICRYLQTRFLPERLGLWSVLPKRFKQYAPIIVETFGAVFPNDHTHKNIFHPPVLVRSKAILGERYTDAVKGCWLQRSWSASVNSQGAYFCEVGAALDLVLHTGTAFDIHARWWLKKPQEYKKQIEALCSMCGICLNLAPRRDADEIDDIDDWWYNKLKNDSPKIKAAGYKKYKGPLFGQRSHGINLFRRDLGYLRAAGKKFGLDLVLQPNGYLRPYMLKG